MTRRGRAAGLGVVIVLALAGCGLLRAPTPVSDTGAPPGAGKLAPRPVRKTAAAHPVKPPSDLLHPRSDRKFFGLQVKGAPDSLNPVQNAAAGINRRPNLLGQYTRWPHPFDARAAANAQSYGALYYVAWEPFKTTLSAIASGDRDSYITKFARAVRSYGDPVAISFGHEMNGNWYPWGTTGATAAEFVDAWRHIHELFAKAGASNVIWVWNPNIINPVPDVQLEPYWPGSAYVDWVGITGYFATTGPDTFDGLYGSTMTEIRQFTDKPFIIAETSVETGGNELTSIDALINGVKETSDMLGFVWFDYDKDGVDWSVGDRPQARAAVASDVASLPLVSVTK
ncbi:MAG: beta-mannanase [Nocardiopsaceae bacterium]|nr:beta-mannanase [Nocardiopsaceae bacterium]